jgi:hypothetical protein
MPLILAIVADPHEAAQLAKLIQGRLAVDLVQAAEVGEGLLALDDRVPDLILTSPLMSPFDDGVLDEYLRGLGPAGAHVQTVRIPVLSEAPKKKPRLGFSLRRSKPETVTPAGCEPKVFADEIAHYLERAAEEKRHAVSTESSFPVTAVEESTPTPPSEEQWTAAYSEDSTPVYTSEATPLYTPGPSSEQATRSIEPDHDAWRSDLLDRPSDDDVTAYEPDKVEAALTGKETKPVELQAAMMEASTPVAAVESFEEPPLDALPIPGPEIAEAALVEDTVVENTVVEDTLIEDTVVEEAAVEEVCLQPETPMEVDEPVDVRREPDTVIHKATEDVVTDSSRATVIAQDVVSSPGGPTGHDARAIKATPSFKAALAAIRAAWGKPSRTTGQDNVVPVDERQPASHRIVSAELADGPEPESMAPAGEVTAPVEVDLTGAVEMLDDPQPESTLVPAPPQPLASTKTGPDSLETDDVYELVVDPEMPELEAKLFAAPAPVRKRDAAPPLVAPQVEHDPAQDTHREESSSRRHIKKKRGSKGAKAKAAASEPPKEPKEVQDEWGMFDPNRCGFAALVDKLEEVAEKKEQPPKGNKVRLISYS